MRLLVLLTFLATMAALMHFLRFMGVEFMVMCLVIVLGWQIHHRLRRGYWL
jgi:hypothetical protein